MASLDERASVFRGRMVDRLPARGISDQRVLAAMRAVPRHRFVERFSGAPPGSSVWSLDDMREWIVDEDCDDETLDLVHDVERALPAPGFDRFDLLTSVSAPGLVAQMLQDLELEPGRRVLEIGLGSGYNAALLATLVEDASLVTSVDIDDALVTQAGERLTRLGFDGLEAVAGDGDEGVPRRAPFDRIVATVGCNDLSPAWFDQLAPDGFVLCPTRHGHAHPIVRAGRDGASRLVAPSGFLKIRGRQDQEIWWPARAPWIPETVDWEPSRFGIDGRSTWDASLYVALRDARATSPVPMLVDGESAAIVETDKGFGRCGADGDELATRLVQLLDDWDSLGRPSMGDYELRWEPRSDAPHVDSKQGPWRIHRVHHDEVVSLSRA